MANKKVVPPIFWNDVSYKFSKSRTQMWEVVCGTPKDEQGITVLLQSLATSKSCVYINCHWFTQRHRAASIDSQTRHAFQDEIAENAYSIYKKN